MFRPRVIPCLLLKGDGLVKTVKFENARYIGDPLNAVKIFNAKQADELIFLDIAASREKRTISVELVEKIADETFMPFAAGGGIRSLSQIREMLSAGAEKVVINTQAILNPRLIREASSQFGSQSIIVSMDVKKKAFGKYKIYSHGGTKATRLDPVDLAVEMQHLGAGELLVNSIDRDGSMAGFDLELLKRVAVAVTVPVVACGGAGHHKDLSSAVYDGHASAVSAGSLFVYHGPKRAVLINFPSKEELKSLFSSTCYSPV